MPRPVRRKYPTSTIGIYKHNRDHLLKIAASMGYGMPVPEAFDRLFGQELAKKAADLLKIERQEALRFVNIDRSGKAGPPEPEPEEEEEVEVEKKRRGRPRKT